MTTLLERRRIEAEFAKAMYEEMVVDLGEQKSIELLGRVAQKLARAMGESLATRDKDNSMSNFADVIPLWQEGGALEITVCEQSDTVFAFDVTRCRYAEMYREIGAEKLGTALSCNRDGSLCEGYNPRIKMSRPETIMAGHNRCNFRFTLDEDV